MIERGDKFMATIMLLFNLPFIVAAIRWAVDGFPGVTK